MHTAAPPLFFYPACVAHSCSHWQPQLLCTSFRKIYSSHAPNLLGGCVAGEGCPSGSAGSYNKFIAASFYCQRGIFMAQSSRVKHTAGSVPVLIRNICLGLCRCLSETFVHCPPVAQASQTNRQHGIAHIPTGGGREFHFSAPCVLRLLFI